MHIFIYRSELNNPPKVLEGKIENVEKKNCDLNYEYSQLKNNNTSIEAEVKTMLEEELKSETLCDVS